MLRITSWGRWRPETTRVQLDTTWYNLHQNSSNWKLHPLLTSSYYKLLQVHLLNMQGWWTLIMYDNVMLSATPLQRICIMFNYNTRIAEDDFRNTGEEVQLCVLESVSPILLPNNVWCMAAPVFLGNCKKHETTHSYCAARRQVVRRAIQIYCIVVYLSLCWVPTGCSVRLTKNDIRTIRFVHM